MEINNILMELTQVFRKTLDNDAIKLQKETTANDVKEWDSLAHIQLIVAIEKYFKIKFKASEIRAFKNVGEMCEAIKIKISLS